MGNGSTGAALMVVIGGGEYCGRHDCLVLGPARRWRGAYALFCAGLDYTSVPIPKFVNSCGTLVRTSESIRTLANNMLASAAFEPEVRNRRPRTLVRTSGSRHLASLIGDRSKRPFPAKRAI
jgi:hypothetical protein